MPIFQYKAKSHNAQTVNGEIAAQNKSEAIEKINQLGLMPILIEEEGGCKASSLGSFGAARVSMKELFTFSRQLSHLLRAGISLLRGLEILRQQTTSEHFRSVILQIYTGIKDGKTLADCLAQHPKIFSTLYVAMVRAGEESGQLKEMIASMAEYSRSQTEIASKVRAAVAYPFIMAIVGVGTIIFMLIFVMPRITGLFVHMEQQLPWITVFFIRASEFFTHAWWILIIGVMAIVGAIRKFIDTPAGHRSYSGFQLNLPFWGSFVMKVQLARFCRSLELLLKSGIPLLRALRLSIPIVDNDFIRDQFEGAFEALSGGNSFGQSLKRARYLPVIMSDLISVAEESGALVTTLYDMANEYEAEVNEQIKILTTLLEPLMIVFVGGIVGFMAMAMLLPIFKLNIGR